MMVNLSLLFMTIPLCSQNFSFALVSSCSFFNASISVFMSVTFDSLDRR